MMRPTCPGVLVAVLPALFFGACLLEPKTGCRTKDDCAPGRVCVAGTCQAPGHDAGLDASFDKQSSADGVTNPSETLSPDLAGGPDVALDLAPPAADVAPDAPAAIDAPGSPAGLDASPERLGPDLVSAPPPDLAPLVVDVAPDAPIVVMADAALDAPAAATIDALDSPGLDASFDKQSSSDGGADRLESLSPDLASDPERAADSAPLPSDTAPDVPIALTIDAPPALDSSGIDAGSADCGGNSDLANTWELIGGTPVSGPGVAQWGPGQNIDVFWRGTDDHLKHKWFPYNDTWSWEQDLGGTMTSEPAATSRPTNMRDVFWRGADNHLMHKWYPLANDWSWEQDLGGTLASSPAAASWASVALHVFWQGTNGSLIHKSMDYATNLWTAETDLGIPVQSDPAVLYRTNGVMDVFWRGSNGALQHTWSSDGAIWSWVQDLGGTIAAGSSPTATSRWAGWVDVFWKGIDNHLKHIWMDPLNGWSLIEEDLGGDLASSPDATFWDAGRIDVFAKDASTGQMAHLVWKEDGVATLNDTDPGITYFGDWIYYPLRGLGDYGDDAHYTTTDGSYFEYAFSGTGVDYIGERCWDEGNVDVYIDNAFQQTINCYSPSTRLVEEVLYSKRGLASGPHTIRISKRDGPLMLVDGLRIYR